MDCTGEIYLKVLVKVCYASQLANTVEIKNGGGFVGGGILAVNLKGGARHKNENFKLVIQKLL